MKKEITHLDVMSVAMVYGALLAAVGLVLGLLFLVFGSMMAPFLRDSDDAGMQAMGGMMGGGLLTVVLFPIMYGILGFVMGAFMAFLYNTVAPRVGGIKLYLRDTADTPSVS